MTSPKHPRLIFKEKPILDEGIEKYTGNGAIKGRKSSTGGHSRYCRALSQGNKATVYDNLTVMPACLK